MGTRSFVNSVPNPSLIPGMDGKEALIVLPATQALLMHQALGSLLYGIRGVRFEEQIGVSEAFLQKLFDGFRLWVDTCKFDAQGVIIIRDERGEAVGRFEQRLSPMEIRSLRNALEVVMLDLGQSEFFTITGFSLMEAKQLLDRWNAALLDPLHLEPATDSVAH